MQVPFIHCAMHRGLRTKPRPKALPPALNLALSRNHTAEVLYSCESSESVGPPWSRPRAAANASPPLLLRTVSPGGAVVLHMCSLSATAPSSSRAVVLRRSKPSRGALRPRPALRTTPSPRRALCPSPCGAARRPARCGRRFGAPTPPTAELSQACLTAQIDSLRNRARPLTVKNEVN